MNATNTRRPGDQPVPVFNPAHYPKAYETRMESYPLRRRAGLFLILVGAITFGVGVLGHTPIFIAGGSGVVAVSFWLARARVSSIVLYADRIEITQGKEYEVRQRAKLLGWKYAQESELRHPGGSGQKWVLLASTDDWEPPLMVEISRPELDRDFLDWVFSLRNLHIPLPLSADMDEAAPAPLETPVNPHPDPPVTLS